MRTTLAVIALALAGLAAGCGDSDNGSDESATEWADGLCSAVSTWTDSMRAAAEDLQRSGLTEEGIDQAVDDVRSATDTLREDLDDLGTPDTEAGDEAEESVEELRTELEEDVDSIEAAVEDVSNVSEALQAAPAVGTSLSSMDTQVRATVQELQGLDPGGELETAFEQASSCDDLNR